MSFFAAATTFNTWAVHMGVGGGKASVSFGGVIGLNVFCVLFSCFRVSGFLSENLCSEADFCSSLPFQANKQRPLLHWLATDDDDELDAASFTAKN